MYKITRLIIAIATSAAVAAGCAPFQVLSTSSKAGTQAMSPTEGQTRAHDYGSYGKRLNGDWTEGASK